MKLDNFTTIFSLLLLIGLTNHSLADTDTESEPAYRNTWKFSVHVGAESFDSEAADEEYIEDTGWSFRY